MTFVWSPRSRGVHPMVSDDELERRIESVDQGVDEAAGVGPEARAVHDELARRIRAVEDGAADAATVAELADRLDAIEERLEALGSRE